MSIKIPDSPHQPCIPAAREQVHAVEAAQGVGHLAGFESHRDDENIIIGQEAQSFERKFQFLVAVSLLFVESFRDTDDDHPAFEDRIADDTLPILPGLQVHRIQPDVQPVANQAPIQSADGFRIFMGMDQKHSFKSRHSTSLKIGNPFKVAHRIEKDNPPAGDLTGERWVNPMGELHPAAEIPTCQDMA